MAFEPHIERPPGRRPELVFAFAGDRLLVRVGSQPALPEQTALPEGERLFLGVLDGSDCLALDLGELSDTPTGHELAGLRPLHDALPDDLWRVAGRAVQILEWDRNHRFCGRCGTQTEPASGERARICPACGLAAYPRISPAVITLVTRGDELLLANGVRHAPGRYSLLAGFVEPGETLEEAVAREIREEVGIEVDEIRYFGSQPWPFPGNVMTAFTARWAAGELRPDKREINDAKFFRADALPELPHGLSIARWVIDATLRDLEA